MRPTCCAGRGKKPADPPLQKPSSQPTLRWRETDSNFRSLPGSVAHRAGGAARGNHMARPNGVLSLAGLIVREDAVCRAAYDPTGRSQPRTNRETVLVAYVGAFTTPERKGHGGGINVYRVNPTSGAWTHEQLFEIANPSFLTLDPAQRFLYSVHADLDEVSAYAIDKQNGHIAALNRQSCGGKNPVHLSIDPTGRWIVTANYSAGSVGVVPIEKDGTLGPRSDLVTLTGEPGPDGKRQTSSHPHDAVFDPNGRFVAVPDLGFDRIFRVSPRRGERKTNAERPALCRHARRCRPAAHRLSSEDAVGICDQRTRFWRPPPTASTRNAAACSRSRSCPV